jgi:hypothetical protein
VLPVSLDKAGLLNDAALRQIVILKSMSQQYYPQGLRVTLRLISPDAGLFSSEAFRNVLTDLDLGGISASHAVSFDAQQLTLSMPRGKVIRRWNGTVGPVALGLALRRMMGEPVYAQMGAPSNE